MAIGDEHVEEPPEVPDGALRDFTTTLAYATGTLRVWLNGLLARAGDDDGWDETGPSSFRTREAPRSGDTIHARFIEA
jgi:hypothetical protein